MFVTLIHNYYVNFWNEELSIYHILMKKEKGKIGDNYAGDQNQNEEKHYKKELS